MTEVIDSITVMLENITDELTLVTSMSENMLSLIGFNHAGVQHLQTQIWFALALILILAGAMAKAFHALSKKQKQLDLLITQAMMSKDNTSP